MGFEQRISIMKSKHGGTVRVPYARVGRITKPLLISTKRMTAQGYGTAISLFRHTKNPVFRGAIRGGGEPTAHSS